MAVLDDEDAFKKGRHGMEMGENHHSPRDSLEIEGLATCRANEHVVLRHQCWLRVKIEKKFGQSVSGVEAFSYPALLAVPAGFVAFAFVVVLFFFTGGAAC